MKSNAKRYVTAALLVLAGLAPSVQADNGLTLPQETKDQRDARMGWWRDAKFGMFIHWGLYAVPAGTYDGKRIGGIGEWIMHDGRIPVATYAKYAQQFNPAKFNADEWVGIAKASGMKYMVITSKHHDGFCMFHSKVDGYNIYDATPFKRDPVQELTDAAPKQGIKFGVYYSQAQDWHHPGGGAYGGHWDPAQDGDYDKYLADKSIPQVKELLDTYNPAVLWFDTSIGMSKERTQQFLDVLKTRPNLIYNNRLGNGVPGDTETPEQTIPAAGFPGRDWETCMTINDTWGYKSYDTNFKSTETLLRNLIDIVSKGGNYLLNVGPTDEGLIPQGEVDRLKEVGTWLAANGDAIYGTTGSPFKKQLAWGRCTQKPGKLYLSVFNWPKDGSLTVPVSNKVTKAYLLVHPDQALTVQSGDDGAYVTVPSEAPTAIASVVVLEIDGAAVAITAPIKQAADGTLKLEPGDADISGSTLRVEGGVPNLGWWTEAGDFPHWQASIDKPGTFTPEFNYAVPADGSEVVLSAGDESVSLKLPSTGDWNKYQTIKLPALKIEKAGPVTFTLKATAKSGAGVMNLRCITLTPG
jgi:alpha-L-fucosidase